MYNPRERDRWAFSRKCERWFREGIVLVLMSLLSIAFISCTVFGIGLALKIIWNAFKMGWYLIGG